MYKGIVFVGYIAAICLAVIGVALFVLIVMMNRSERSKLFKAVRNFSVMILMVSILYFYFYCRENLMGLYTVPVLWRVIDYLLCGAAVYAWFDVLARLETKIRVRNIGIVLGGLQALVGVFMGIFFEDGYYAIANEMVSGAFAVYECLMTVCIIIAALVFTMHYFRGEVDSQRRTFAGLNTALLLIWEIDQAIVDTGLYEGRFGASAWKLHIFDPTSILMLLMAGVTFLFVFREDFSPLYDRKDTTEEEEPDFLSIISEESRLTVREAETMRLVYDGYSNLEIADEMDISVNTVKKHTKNIYSKMGVTSRMDMVHFINEKREMNK